MSSLAVLLYHTSRHEYSTSGRRVSGGAHLNVGNALKVCNEVLREPLPRLEPLDEDIRRPELVRTYTSSPRQYSPPPSSARTMMRVMMGRSLTRVLLDELRVPRHARTAGYGRRSDGAGLLVLRSAVRCLVLVRVMVVVLTGLLHGGECEL